MTTASLNGGAAGWSRGAIGLLAAQVALALLTLAGWEFLIRSGALSNPALVPVSDTAVSLLGHLVNPELWAALAQTALSWLIGVSLCLAIGAPLGAFLGSRPSIYATARFTLEFLRATPPVVLIPFMLLLLGPTQEMKVVLIVLGAVWPLLVQTMYGVHDMDPVAVETARVYRIRRLVFVSWFVAPSITPYIMTGMRVSGMLALLLSIGSEMITSAPGLGRQILYAQSNGAMDAMYALIVVAGVMGVTFNALCNVAERRILKWHPSQRGVAQ